MRFGVNYTPRQGWFYHWLDFSPVEIARDLDAIAALGVDHIRIFPLWPLIQPHRGLIRPAALKDVERVLELADQRGLDVCVDGLQGHLSSFDFLPAWLTSWHRRDMFTDPDVIESTATYLTDLATTCAAHPNLMALTVGNEVNQFTGAAHPQPFLATEDEAGAWASTMIEALRRGAEAGRPQDARAGGAGAADDREGVDRTDRGGGTRDARTHGSNADWGGVAVVQACYDATWYDPAQPFTPTQAARLGDLTVVHSWVFNGTAQRYGPDSFETRAHARYLVEVARAFQADPARPVWVQEVGTPHTVIPTSNTEAFMEATVNSLLDAPHLFGITWWASHDVSPTLADFPPVEYTLGLIDTTGHIKPEGRLFRDLVAQARSTASTPLPRPTMRSTEVSDRLEAHPTPSHTGPNSVMCPTEATDALDAHPTASPTLPRPAGGTPIAAGTPAGRSEDRWGGPAEAGPPADKAARPAPPLSPPTDPTDSTNPTEPTPERTNQDQTIVLDLTKVGGRAALAPGGVFWQTYMRQARQSGHPRILIEGDRHA
ncbi:MAG: cellulase family glycosylhydrolase [Propionibacteriaceae bacterium]|nr:cellulase family glycosylhydrolase [Propionibacteriaceae bacterium]